MLITSCAIDPFSDEKKNCNCKNGNRSIDPFLEHWSGEKPCLEAVVGIGSEKQCHQNS